LPGGTRKNLAGLPGDLELAAFCDRNAPKAQALAEHYTGGTPAIYTDQRELFGCAAAAR
jgi:hypothetical protein